MAEADGTTRGTPVRGGWSRWEPVTGIAFVVLAVAAFHINPAPGDGDSNAVWLKAYSNSGYQIEFVIAGFMLVVASLCLISFVTNLWLRIAAARRPQRTSPLPLVAAGMAATAIALGAVLQGVVSGTMIVRATLPDAGSLRLPSADILRFTADAFFAFVSLGGMFPLALAIAVLGLQARSAGLFGPRFATTSIVVAIVTLFSFGYYPMVVPLIWVVVVSVMLLRRDSDAAKSPTTVGSMAARTPTASAGQS
jgi:hypothetical protein